MINHTRGEPDRARGKRTAVARILDAYWWKRPFTGDLPWTALETKDPPQPWDSRAGGKEPPFANDDGVYKTLFAYSKGLPRDAVKVCDEVLRELIASKRERATSGDVEKIAKELNLTN